MVPYLSPMVLRKEVESFIIQEGGKGLEKEELVRDRCAYREKGAEEGWGGTGKGSRNRSDYLQVGIGFQMMVSNTAV